MNYYTSTIPLPLAEKLKEKGMPVEIVCDNTVEHSFPPEYHCETIFAEVFDWLTTRGIYISICHRETSVGIEWYPMVNGKCPRVIDGKEWQHSAEAAIEKALTLI